MWSLERDQVIQVGRLRGIEKFEGEIENFILNTFINFKPVKRYENRSGRCTASKTLISYSKDASSTNLTNRPDL